MTDPIKRKMPRIKIVQLGDLKTGDQISVMGQVADLHPSLLPLMDHTNGIARQRKNLVIGLGTI